jgi:site-specific DNA-methyltransferase (adenine-specific)
VILEKLLSPIIRRVILLLDIKTKNIFYDNGKFTLIEGDSFKLLKKIPLKSVDMIFADPPYFLSGNGITCVAGKMVSVNKAIWDEEKTINNKLAFNRKWIKLCYQILKDDGSIWISGTMHNIYSIGVALSLEGFKIINNITWQKKNPPPNISCRTFVHSTETVLWAKKSLKKSKHLFNYSIMKELNDNKQMKDVWKFSLTRPSEKKEGKHPTQKPLELLKRIIISSTIENQIVLDPFCGSGTTGIACAELKRNFIGIDNEKHYLDITLKRYRKLVNK